MKPNLFMLEIIISYFWLDLIRNMNVNQCYFSYILFLGGKNLRGNIISTDISIYISDMLSISTKELITESGHLLFIHTILFIYYSSIPLCESLINFYNLIEWFKKMHEFEEWSDGFFSKLTYLYMSTVVFDDTLDDS